MLCGQFSLYPSIAGNISLQPVAKAKVRPNQTPNPVLALRVVLTALVILVSMKSVLW
jgi:hypothetical protein